MSRSKFKSDAKKRDGTRFAVVPFVVLESEAYVALSGSAVKLLMEFAFQYNGANNGNLYCTWDQMASRGWKSQTTLKAAKDELVRAGFLCETRKGARPNRAAWYALTWRELDVTEGLDITASAFPRGAYLRVTAKPKPAAKPVERRSAKIIPLTPVSGVAVG
ncbi:hypothetical protein [Burkholderia gladioli]|uniref:hypothetical protein n=1 Tax=Burkholderia gladioli TaxID=28095 RepID=UPI001640B106|nr:hypothetical protein [Burkholderia gladioli]